MAIRNFCFQMAHVLVSRYDEIDNAICNAPSNKIQLCDSCGDAHELDSLRPTERIKEFFRVPIQAGLVSDVHHECFSVTSLVRDIFAF